MKRLFFLLALPGCILLTNALRPICGDGFIQEDEEGCDDGNVVSGDGCSDICALELCGDGLILADEACDDGNLDDGGCDTACAVENGFVCTGEPSECTLPGCNNDILEAGEVCDGVDLNENDCADFGGAGTLLCSADCQSFDTTGCVVTCGDGLLGDGEQCDDGNGSNDDNCPDGTGGTCQLASCGDGFVLAGDEECDDGNLTGNDRCKNDCTFPDIVKLDAGDEHTCAQDEFGAVKCWGLGSLGRLGYGNSDNIGDGETIVTAGSLALEIGTVPFSPTVLSVGGEHNCVIGVINGFNEAFCWGNGANGRLGYGSTNNIGDTEDPSDGGEIFVGGGFAIDVVAGGSHTCAILENNQVRCWGANGFGQLGFGSNQDVGDGANEFPGSINSIDFGAVDTVTSIALGGDHSCAILTNTGIVRCWGKNDVGQLGIGNTVNLGDVNGETPSVDVIFDTPNVAATKLTAGASHTCALLSNNQLRCWGGNSQGQLGQGNVLPLGDNENLEDEGIVNVGFTVAQFSAGGAHTCALSDAGSIRCWGRNDVGQLGFISTANFGDETGEIPNTAPLIEIANDPFTQVTAGKFHTCALTSSGLVFCWGSGANGKLGNQNASNAIAPIFVNLF